MEREIMFNYKCRILNTDILQCDSDAFIFIGCEHYWPGLIHSRKQFFLNVSTPIPTRDCKTQMLYQAWDFGFDKRPTWVLGYHNICGKPYPKTNIIEVNLR
jgi:hypothetical protein